MGKVGIFQTKKDRSFSNEVIPVYSLYSHYQCVNYLALMVMVMVMIMMMMIMIAASAF